MAQQVWFPAPVWQLKTICSSRAWETDGLFWALRVLHAHGTHTYAQTNTHTQKTKETKY